MISGFVPHISVKNNESEGKNVQFVQKITKGIQFYNSCAQKSIYIKARSISRLVKRF